jgi:hypothetical protein
MKGRSGDVREMEVGMESHAALRRLAVDRGHIEYVDAGAGDPILPVHAGGFGAWFAPLAEEPGATG